MNISATTRIFNGLNRRLIATALSILLLAGASSSASAQDLYPKHIDARTQQAIKRGLEYLAKNQTPDGNFNGGQDATAYPTTVVSLAGMAFLCGGNTPSRGPYSENVKRAEMWLLGMAR